MVATDTLTIGGPRHMGTEASVTIGVNPDHGCETPGDHRGKLMQSFYLNIKYRIFIYIYILSLFKIFFKFYLFIMFNI